jgi:tetrahydromethanopterin S-methyltransferase subunit C
MSGGGRGHTFEMSRATLERNVMESTVSRRAVNVGPARPRPGLALLFSLLAIPGSTLAWDLPAGGLWIGLPLAVAAIVIGLRARRELAGGRGTGMASAALVIAGLCIAQMVVWTLASVIS